MPLKRLTPKTPPLSKKKQSKKKGKSVNRSSSNPERRRSPRLDHTIPVKISSDDVEIVTETKNLSATGAYCRVNKYLEPMTKLKIHLLLSLKKNQKPTTKKITCQGVVVRTEAVPNSDYFHTAIFFNDITPKDGQVLKDYVDAMLEQKNQSTPEGKPG